MIIRFFDNNPSIETKFLEKHKSNRQLIESYCKTYNLLAEALPFSPILKKHKIVLKLKNVFSVAINQKYRIIFVYDEIEEPNIIYIAKIGDHSIYNKK